SPPFRLYFPLEGRDGRTLRNGGGNAMATERRTAQRYDVSELSFVTKPGESRAGLLVDISREGAMIEFIEPLAQVHHGFRPGDRVNLSIDELGEVTGRVSRTTEK